MSDKPRKTSARTEATRARIISAAEELFAERGVASVSLNEITRAAGQKNRNAVHYHFGSKEALLQAIFEKHWRPIGTLRRELLSEIDERDSVTLEDLAGALVRPVAERFNDPDGGIAYIRISAQLAAANMLDFEAHGGVPGDDVNYGADMASLWVPFLAHLPGPVREHRMSLMVGMLFHGLADHAVYRESSDADLANTELMVSNLIDSICAVLRAPASAATLELSTK
jgi:AcrR family transcriptional regulator